MQILLFLLPAPPRPLFFRGSSSTSFPLLTVRYGTSDPGSPLMLTPCDAPSRNDVSTSHLTARRNSPLVASVLYFPSSGHGSEGARFQSLGLVLRSPCRRRLFPLSAAFLLVVVTPPPAPLPERGFSSWFPVLGPYACERTKGRDPFFTDLFYPFMPPNPQNRALPRTSAHGKDGNSAKHCLPRPRFTFFFLSVPRQMKMYRVFGTD